MVSQLTKTLLQIANPEQLERIRHTCAHAMAMAVQILFPETKVTIGPTTDTGFYYDFARPQPFTPEDLSKITQQMRLIIKANLPIIREEVNRKEIKAEIEQLGEPYKLEILDSIAAEDYWLFRAFLWDFSGIVRLAKNGSKAIALINLIMSTNINEKNFFCLRLLILS
ncbi:MAG: threonyl-tRNA synthetase [Cyanobacteriota bacterium]|jgi:threonyl-tRNA synthetase